LNILNIAVKEIKHNLRDRKSFIFMLAMPIVLMLILGLAFTNIFNSKVTVGDVNVLYKDTADAPVSSAFQAFANEAGKSGIHFKQATEKMSGKKEVEENNYTAYVELTEKGIQLFGSNQDGIEEGIIQGMLTAFADKYNLAAAVARVDATKVSTVMTSSFSHDYIKEKSLQSPKQPGSMDYYAMAMTTMIALYGAMAASSLIRGERARNTAFRLLATPVSKGEIFLGKILGCLVVNAIFLSVVVGFSHFVFKANWGDHFGIVALVLLSEVFLAVSFGLGISYIAKTGEASRIIIMLVIQLSSFFGGAYFRIGDATGIISIVTNLSPLTWANHAITKIIYANDIGAAFPAIGLNLGIAVLFLAFTIISLQRREGL
jgi:ABC-2 type transport system permease protein